VTQQHAQVGALSQNRLALRLHTLRTAW
jgi:hypothetical protein